MEPAYDYLVKLLIVGGSKTGKTNIVSRFVENSFNPNHFSTIGNPIFKKLVYFLKRDRFRN